MSDIREDIVALLPRLQRFAYTLTGSRDEADDLLQEACEKALGRLAQFQPGSRLDSWMFRILQTTWIDKGRWRQRRPQAADSELELALLAVDDRIEQRVEARAALDIVRRTMAALPEEQRAVLGLCAIDGLSYQEAADILEIPIGTVMSRLARARKKLADAVDGPAINGRGK